jgi:uncharacterized membrane protein YccF (DUF307 family)
VSTVVVSSQKRTGCLTQVLWFLFIGWWVGEIWIVVAWFLMLIVVGIPVGVKMLNKLPQVLALRGPGPTATVVTDGNVTVVSQGGQVPQHNILVRALYFLLIGWWFSFVWVEVAYVLCLTMIGLPVGFWMFDRVPALVSLRR